MTWKKFKQEKLSLDYTVMLLPHSQKKPIHFKTPVWTFLLFFLFLLSLTGATLFFAGSRLQLEQVREEKAQLEKEWELLAAQKKQAEEENETLRLAREVQEQEIVKLEQRTRDTLKELEELVEREAQIREELGLQQMLGADEGDGQGEADGADAGEDQPDGPAQAGADEADEEERQAGEGTGVGAAGQADTQLAAADPAAAPVGQDTGLTDQWTAGQGIDQAGQAASAGQTGLALDGSAGLAPDGGAFGTGAEAAVGDGPGLAEGALASDMADPQSAVRTASQIAGAAGGTVQIASVGLPVELAENAADFQAIQSELSYLQDSLAEKTGQYESYQNLITEQKEAEAAQIAQREALRRDIVGNALQYVGNRYVYGGNDPNTGVDCSGFTRYVLGNTAGVYLNRTAASQSTQGQAVSAEEARPGDLVFYSNGGGVNHVAIYIGDGQVVHASNERTGIITSDMYYRTPVRIMNVLGD